MSGASLPWRAILWAERFLPAAPAIPDASRSAKRSRWTMAVAFLPAGIGAATGYRAHDLHLSREWWPVIAGLTVVMLVAIAVAAAAFGVKAWRDASHA